MMRVLSKEEVAESRRETRRFLKENESEMHNYMRDIKQFRHEGKEKEKSRIVKLIKSMRLSPVDKERIIDKINEEKKKEHRRFMLKHDRMMKQNPDYKRLKKLCKKLK